MLVVVLYLDDMLVVAHEWTSKLFHRALALFSAVPLNVFTIFKLFYDAGVPIPASSFGLAGPQGWVDFDQGEVPVNPRPEFKLFISYAL